MIDRHNVDDGGHSVGLSLQRKLELAGELARVQPLLMRLHLIEKPKKRRPVRTLIVAGSVIALVTVVAAVVFGRKRCQPSAPADLQGFAQTGPDAAMPDTAPEPETTYQPAADVPA
jgi:hypothetical protein